MLTFWTPINRVCLILTSKNQYIYIDMPRKTLKRSTSKTATTKAKTKANI